MWVFLAYVFSILGILYFIFKIVVIYQVEGDPYGGGGAPTMDFILLAPIIMAVFVSILLKHHNIYPFRFFGVVLYLALMAFYSLVYFVVMKIAVYNSKKDDSR